MMQQLGPPTLFNDLYGMNPGDKFKPVVFPKQKFRQPGYEVNWQCLLTTGELPNVQIGDWLDVRLGLTFIARPYMVDIPVYIMLWTEIIDQTPKLIGYPVLRTSGPNGNSMVPYVPKHESGWVQIKRLPAVVSVVACPESTRECAPIAIQVPAGNYNYLWVSVHRDDSPPPMEAQGWIPEVEHTSLPEI